MKKIYYLLCLVVVVLATACTHEEEDLFDSSSAKRADAAVRANLEVLTAANNGWLMEYFPDKQQSYGGYNVLLKFGTDGKVAVASEIYGSADVASSLYSVKQSAGVTLSFDTYNEIFHFFSDPSDPSGLGGDGFGMEGDYDFSVLEASPEKVLLKGKKTGSMAVLTPVKNGWSEYITTIKNADAAMYNNKYKLQINEIEIPVVASANHTLTFSYEEGGSAKSQLVSYLVTPLGYKFYAPVVIKGLTLEYLAYDASTEIFTSTSQPDVKMVKHYLPLNEAFVGGNWYFVYSGISDALKPYFAKAANGSASEGEQISYMYMGKAKDGTYSFNFKSGNYLGYLTYKYTLIGEDQVTLNFALAGDGNGTFYYQNCDYGNVTTAIGSSSGVTYKLETDNVKAPNYITLTNVNDPGKTMTLYPNEISDPFKK